MPVPYFSKDRSFNIYQKISAIFVLKKVWKIDITLLVIFGGLLTINFVFHIFYRGVNDFKFILQPIDSLFNNSISWGKWLTPYNILYILVLIFLVVYRSFSAVKFLEKLQLFSENNPADNSFGGRKIKVLIFLPFASFSLYDVISELSKFEVLDKYNL